MYDVLPVRVIECRGDPAHEIERLLERDLAVAQQTIAQRFALYDGHHVVKEPAGFTRVEERNDVGVIQSRSELDLSQEAIGAERGAELRVENLEGDFSFMPQVHCKKDSRHPAAAELAIEAITRRQS